MADFKTQIEDLTGSVGDDAALTQWLTDGAKEVFRALPPNLKENCITISEVTSSSGLTNIDTKGEIVAVTRADSSGGIIQTCRRIPTWAYGKAVDPDSLLYYGTVTDPVYYIYNNSLRVKPDPNSSGQDAVVHHLVAPSVANTDDVIAAFSDEAEHLVVLYAAKRAIQRLLNNKSSDLPGDIDSVVIGLISTSLPTYTGPSDFVLPAPPAGVDVDFSEVGTVESFETPVFSSPDLGAISSMNLPVPPSSPTMAEKSVSITGTAPTYIQPALFFEDITISDLSITSNAPVSPSIDLSSVTITGTAPTYTHPVLSFDSLTISDLSISESAPVAPAMSEKSITINGTAPTYTQPVISFPDITIADLSITAVQPVAPATASFSTPTIAAITVATTTLTNAGATPLYVKPDSPSQTSFEAFWPLSEFGDNDPGALSISSVVPVAPTLTSNSVSFTTTAPTYTGQVVAPDFSDANTWLNTEEDSEMVGARMSIIQGQIQEYQSKIQNELNNFNKENTEYQAQLQKSIQDAQLASSDDSQLLQKYSSELQSYQSNVSKEVQEYQQKLSRYQLELNTQFQAWSKTESDKYQKYQLDISSELNSFNRANAEYQVKLQEAIQQAQIDAQKASQQAQLDSQDAQQEANLLLQKETQEYSSNLQRYSNELQSYTQNINKEVQEYQQNFQKEFQIWQTKRQT